MVKNLCVFSGIWGISFFIFSFLFGSCSLSAKNSGFLNGDIASHNLSEVAIKYYLNFSGCIFLFNV